MPYVFYTERCRPWLKWTDVLDNIFAMKNLALIFLLSYSFANAQTDDTLGVAVWSLKGGVIQKPAHGTLFLAGGYRINRAIEFNLGPTFGLFFYNGIGLIGSVNYRLNPTNRFYVNTELAYRFIGGGIDRNDFDSLEYAIPITNFVSLGIGINYRFKTGEILNLMPTYNLKLANYDFELNYGQSDANIEKSIRARLNSGFGLTVSLSRY